tara:strand:+ start:277 stop:1215 length:939 start_codon:yes stop_codon:yes gene_type:complete
MPDIEHLVLSAGGVNGFKLYGAAREAAKLGLWRVDKIKTIHGSSAGAMMGAMLALGYDWDWLDDYLIKRPWESLIAADERMLEAYSAGGVYGLEVAEGILSPLLEAKGHSKDITLGQFCAATGIDMYVIATEVNTPLLTKVIISPKTHGDWPLVTAIGASAAYPLLFRPVRKDGMCLVDGGLLSLYPMSECLTNGWPPETVLGFRLAWPLEPEPVGENASLIDVASALLRRTLQSVCSRDHRNQTTEGVVEVTSSAADLSFDSLREATGDAAQRLKLVNEGAAAARETFLRVRGVPPPTPPTETSEQTGAEI